jgi:hypothetical protein
MSSTSQPQYVLITNKLASAITIMGMTIAGTNSADFVADGECIGIISGNQTCEMFVTFTPGAMGARAASLQIAITGQTTTVNIPLEGTGGNPIPTITTVSPATIYVNSATTTVAITGSGFLSSSLVYTNNSSTPLTTTYVSATKVTAQIPDTLLGQEGTLFLYVANPQPAGGSASFTEQVVGGEPSIGAVSPSSIVAGTASEPIVINGQNFMSTAKVQWNGTNIPTTFISPNQLQAQPTTAELASGGIVQLTVANPAPGTISQFVNFEVTDPITVTVLDLPANDLVWDPFAQLIYASLPSSYGVNGNSIATINPATGAVTGYHFAGSEPTKLALDANSKYLYVGLNGSGSIQRLALPGFTPDISINLGQTNQSLNLAQAIAVSPTNAQLIAVSLTGNFCCGGGGSPLEFFSGTTKLANSVGSPAMSQLVFASGTTLYGYANGTLSQVTVSSTGGTLNQTWTDMVTGGSISYSGGLIFGANGQVFNPASGLLEGTFDVFPASCCNNGNDQILSESNINRAFVLGQTPFDTFGITSYNLTQFTPSVVSSLDELNIGFNSSISHPIQWSTNGMAFIVSTNPCCGSTSTQVVLVQSPTLFLTSTRIPSPTPISSAMNPATVTHGTGNFRLTVKGSGFVPGSTITWNGRKASVSYVNSKQMTVYVPKSQVATPGSATIQVKNPSPGGGTSSTLTLTVN